MTHYTDGRITLHSRAETWECDFNGHWNTRFYCQNFEYASKVTFGLFADQTCAPAQPAQRHLRFHAEVHGGDPIVVRSFYVPDTPYGPAVAHYMLRYNKLVATAVDFGAAGSVDLPVQSLEQAKIAMPRGIVSPQTDLWDPVQSGGQIYELGPVEVGEFGADGTMAFSHAVARMAYASHHHDFDLGFTLELMAEQAIGRMLAEMRFVSLGPVAPNDFLRVSSRMQSAAGKAFHIAHLLYTHRGTPVAMFDLLTLAVDMQARRAIALPDFVTARLG